MNSCNKYKYSKSHFSEAKRKLKSTMCISEFESKKCNFQYLCGNIHWLAWFNKFLRLCSQYDRFYSKIIMLRNDLFTQPAECSRMKCPHVMKKGPLISHETWRQL